MALSKIRNDSLEDNAVHGRRNLIINGDMQVAQRGTSFTCTNGTFKTLDRFEVQEGAGGATTYTVTQDSDAPSNFTKSLKIANSTAVTLSSAQYGIFVYPIEGFDIIQTGMGTSGAKDLTLSFLVKSSLTGTFGVALRAGVATTANYIAEYTIVSANTWEQKTITYPAISSGTWNTDNTRGADIIFDLGTGSNFTNTSGAWNTAGTNLFGLTGGTALNGTAGATLNITGIQLEIGEQATPFEHRSYGEELALCQRYYEMTGAGAPAKANSSTEFWVGLKFQVAKRANPTVSMVDPNTAIRIFEFGIGNRDSDSTPNISSAYYNLHGANVRLGTFSGISAGDTAITGGTPGDNSANQFAFDAEL